MGGQPAPPAPFVKEFAAPGQPPRPGLVWKEETHRWVHPDTGEEMPDSPAASKAQPKPVELAVQDTARTLVNNARGVKTAADLESLAERAITKIKGQYAAEWNHIKSSVAAKYGDAVANDPRMANVRSELTLGLRDAIKTVQEIKSSLSHSLEAGRIKPGSLGFENASEDASNLSKTQAQHADKAYVALADVVSRHTSTKMSHAEIVRFDHNEYVDDPSTADRVQTTAPASGEVALPGKDGRALAKLIRSAKAAGVKLLSSVVAQAVKHYGGSGPLLSSADLDKIATSYAAVNATADLLGRSRVREMTSRAATFAGLHRFSDESLSTFADLQPDVLATPEAALEYFRTLIPTLGVDPQRYAGEQRRRAFTLAASTNEVLTERIQKVIAEGLENNQSVADTTANITADLEAAGVAGRNPQYAEMVYRTNAMDSFQTGMYEEGRQPDVREMFPVWEYLGIDDERTGEDHRPKFNNYYPADAPFAKVRGDRPYNCRCSMRWVDKFEWDDLQAEGKRVESSW